MVIFFIILLIAMLVFMAYNRVSLVVATSGCVAYLVLLSMFSGLGLIGLTLTWMLFAAILIPLNIPYLRRAYLIQPLFGYASKKLPTLSETEEQALQAGTVNWDGELFSGAPNWEEFLELSTASLSKEEQNFIDTKAETLASMIDNWDIVHNRFDYPENVKDYIKENGFMSFGIPTEDGGLQFSDFAHSEVLVKIGSRSSDVIQFVAVPNSLGPAELIRKYGTDAQKKFYLPRLAKGIEIPCFALTAPLAGSDASGMVDRGVVEKGMFEGKEIIGIRLNFDKRYITLAPIATLVGLAFKLYDPEHLMGNVDEYGITCALLPHDTKGLKTGRRHYPLYNAFPNGPVRGKDVFIPLDWIIGGPDMAGKGWKMLIECLSVGRAISIPTGAITAAKAVGHGTALYCKIRRAFRVPIGKFEGIQEKLAENASFTYIIDAIRLFTLAAIDRGEKPAAPSAISKYHVTEMARRVVNNAMDIHGGKGIMMGPRNYVASAYTGALVGITVEGANILTRNMIIFGQGGIRCHPYILKEVLAIRNNDIKEFEGHLMGHLGFAISNAVRSFFLGITGARLVSTPPSINMTKRYFQQVTRLSSAFAFVADVCMILLGGKLKFKESISARLGDALSMLYILSAVLKRYQDEGQPNNMLPIVHWSCQHLLFEAEEALDGISQNFSNRWVGFLMRIIVFPLGRRYRKPNDKLRHQVAELVLDSEDVRARLAKGIYLSPEGGNLLHKLDDTVKQLEATLEIEERIIKAQREKVFFAYNFPDAIKAAQKSGIITADEQKKMSSAYSAMMDVIDVDDFDPKELTSKHK